MLSNEPRPNEMHDQGVAQRLLAREDKCPPMQSAGFASAVHSSEPDLKKEASESVSKNRSFLSQKRAVMTKMGAGQKIQKEQKNILDSELYGAPTKKLVSALMDKSPSMQEEEQENSQKKKRISCYQIAEALLETEDWRVEDGMLLHYEEDRGYWRLIPKSNENRELRSSIGTEFATEINKNTLSEIYEWLVLKASPFPTAESADSTDYLNLRDLALKWLDGSTTVHKRKKMYFRYYLNISSEDLQKARNGSFKSYLKTIYPEDKETKKEFKKFLGIALSGFRAEKTAVILHGPSSTGKSVFLNLLEKLMGNELTASVSFSQMNQEFTLTQMLGKSLSLSAEISGTNNKRLDIFKSITGRDKLTMCFKTKDFFQSRFHCMLIFASNVFPQISDVRELEIFLQRVQIFPFDNVVPRSEWVDNLEELLYEDRGTILHMAMEGLRAWDSDKRQFVESRAMREKKTEFKRECNSFEVFLEEYACINPKSRVSHQAINRRYEEFCLQEGFIPLAGNVWPTVLKETWPVKSVMLESRDPNTGEITRNRGYQGIELISTPYDSNVSSQIFESDK